ncbi:hypothetical protein OBBRIDRAFT_788200 [Obba rivulosa]|uniref:Uncharacterized protein n=1 Tax=Obba rivulosa TaxID=1052685 RepID=A0A8E2DTP3_9APHY|nr:hypothetical protein OBBRIDRAFT_788200 [Obba rivulosa]
MRSLAACCTAVARVHLPTRLRETRLAHVPQFRNVKGKTALQVPRLRATPASHQEMHAASRSLCLHHCFISSVEGRYRESWYP